MLRLARELKTPALVVLVALLVMAAALPVAHAQSAQQMQQLMSMSPAERERLMRQMGISDQDVQRMLGEHGIDSPRRGGGTDQRTDMDEPDWERERQRPGDEAYAPSRREIRPQQDERDMAAPVDYGLRYGLEVFSRGLHRGYQELFSIPVPDDYVVGPGDTFHISLFGTETAQHYLPVQRDGWIDFPSLGPIVVAGKSFADARELISERIGREKLGVRASITLEQLKSIQLSVSGEVHRPGVYVVPSLVSVIQLLNLAGGPTEVGTLRQVRLLRAGETRDIDLYEFLVGGSSAEVISLKPGDRLHVPAVSGAAQVRGAVRRPGVYEVLSDESLEDLVAMAGGPSSNAALKGSVLRQFTDGGRQELLDLDLSEAGALATSLTDGMILRVPRASDFTERQIEVQGEVTVQGRRQWRPGMRLSDIFQDLRRDVQIGRADLDYGYVVRTEPDSRAISFLGFSLRDVHRDPGGDADLRLQQEDTVIVLPMPGVVARHDEDENGEPVADERERAVRRTGAQQQAPDHWRDQHVQVLAPQSGQFAQPGYSMGMMGQASPTYRPMDDHELGHSRSRQPDMEREELGRDDLLAPFIERLNRQVRDGSTVPVFTVAGQVHAPGTYPITQQKRLRDALLAGGGLLESADLGNAVLLRRETASGALEVFTVDLDSARGEHADMTLKPGDVLTVRRDPALANRVEVEISGEVGSPGLYTLPAGSRLSDLIDLAGGVTRRADMRAAIFSRARLREMEQELRTRYVAEIRKSLIDAGVAGDRRAEASPAVLDLLDQLEEAISDETDGRLQIDLPRLAQGDRGADMELSDGDRLRIPSITGAISVAGQVRSPGSFSHVPGMTVAQYLELAGGLGPYSDESEIFVLRADGSVQPISRRSMVRFGRDDEDLLPGDRIVVPIEYGYINRWDLAKEVVQFIYQTGIGLAAVVAALR